MWGKKARSFSGGVFGEGEREEEDEDGEILDECFTSVKHRLLLKARDKNPKGSCINNLTSKTRGITAPVRAMCQ